MPHANLKCAPHASPSRPKPVGNRLETDRKPAESRLELRLEFHLELRFRFESRLEERLEERLASQGRKANAPVCQFTRKKIPQQTARANFRLSTTRFLRRATPPLRAPLISTPHFSAAPPFAPTAKWDALPIGAPAARARPRATAT